MALTDAEVARYARQLLLPGMGEAAQEALRDARIRVTGGGLAVAPATYYLAAAGVGTLWFDDPDEVKPEAGAGFALGPDDLGRPRGAALAGFARWASGLVTADLFRPGSRPTALLVCGSSPDVSRAIADEARLLQLPHVVADVDGQGGAVTSVPVGSPCYSCATRPGLGARAHRRGRGDDGGPRRAGTDPPPHRGVAGAAGAPHRGLPGHAPRAGHGAAAGLRLRRAARRRPRPLTASRAGPHRDRLFARRHPALLPGRGRPAERGLRLRRGGSLREARGGPGPERGPGGWAGLRGRSRRAPRPRQASPQGGRADRGRLPLARGRSGAALGVGSRRRGRWTTARRCPGPIRSCSASTQVK